MGNGGVVDRKKTQAFPIGYPHWHGIAFEERPETIPLGSSIGYIFVGRHPPAPGIGR